MILDKFSLEGKVAIVTGGGTGLGKAMCHALARAGASVVVAARRPEPINETAAEVRKLGQRAMAIPTDVIDSRQVENLMEKAIGEFNHVDILVNNAGIARGIEPSPWDATPIQPGPIWELSDEKWHNAIDINLTGAFYCCRAIAKHMIKRRSGKVINMASVGGLRGSKGWFTYCSAKGGVVMLTKSLAMEWAKYNIRVNAIAPGYIKTPLLAQSLEPGNIGEEWVKLTPMGRLGEPSELKGVALFLASKASSFMTGSTIIIDGGYTCW
jgi:NAD(P)-dependent dehydrogenase (short-subunit alcohol dehydrogenase family)